MALESATYIDQLNVSNPAATDGLSQADDHLRMIKSVLKNTFPNITGPVTASQSDLNGGLTPVGIITLWYGAPGDVPDGWALCTGQTVARSDGSGDITTPDLRDKFALGAGGSLGASGGAASATVNSSSAGSHSHGGSSSTSGSHSHGGNTAGHVLTIDQMPAHSHGYDTWISGYRGIDSGDNLRSVNQQSSSVGGNQAHSHGISADGGHNHTITTDAAGAHTHSVTVGTLPPYVALHYIMKV